MVAGAGVLLVGLLDPLYRPADATVSRTVAQLFGWPGVLLAAVPLALSLAVVALVRPGAVRALPTRVTVARTLSAGPLLTALFGTATVFVGVAAVRGAILLCALAWMRPLPSARTAARPATSCSLTSRTDVGPQGLEP